MTGRDILEALNHIDDDMIKDAEEYIVQGSRPGHGVLSRIMFAAATIIIAVGVCLWMSRISSQKPADEPERIVNNQSESPEVSNAIQEDNVRGSSGAEHENEMASIEPNEVYTVAEHEDNLILFNPDTGVVELNPAKRIEYFGAVVSYSDSCSVNMERIFSEAEKLTASTGISKQDIYYLVQIEISVRDEKPGIAIYSAADEKINKEEYDRLTGECRYKLKWLPPGGYRIPESYLYCLVNGRIYGTMTEDEIRNLERCDKYRYNITLISYENVEMENWEYQENYTELELQMSIWHSLLDSIVDKERK